MALLTSFIFYDLTLLVLFTLFVILFLYKNRKNVEKEGILYLYKTKIGMRAMDKIANKFKTFWYYLGYFIVFIGYILMTFIVIYLIYTVYEYLKRADLITQVIGNAPPIALFIPYFPRIFGYQSMFPDFWFVYFIVVIAIIAIVHEGAHGVYARVHGIKIKSTGFGFLGPILAFFVEQDDKDMEKKKIFPQLSVLAAGVFANLITALIFFILLVLFFNMAYAPVGVNIADYSSQVIPISQIEEISVTDQVLNLEEIKLTKVLINGIPFFALDSFVNMNEEELSNYEYVRLYQDQPAINKELKGTIVKINDVEIKNIEDLSREIESKEVGEKIILTTLENNNLQDYEITLSKDYTSDRPVIGIAVGNKPSLQIFGLIETTFKKPGIEYSPKNNKMIFEFFYYLFLWIIFTNFLLAILNMLPVGIFDGGKFFYLTILAITKSEKIAEKFFKASTWIILLSILLLMLRWFISLI
jgi:membrane-associated protease RseP (regulator of RpoE activity)